MEKFVEELTAEIEAAVQEKITWTGQELLETDQQAIETLVEGIVPKQGLFSVVGSSDTGKSMLLRQLVICVALGIPFLGFAIQTTHGKALFIATEDDHVSTSWLLQKQMSGLPRSGMENVRFHFETDGIIEYLEEQLEAEPVDLIIIDAWSDVFGQNLNDSALIRQTLNQYRSLANKYGCAIGFLHHTGKRTENLKPSKNNILSGQGFEAKMRLVMELRNDSEDQDLKHLCVIKGNYLSRDFKDRSFKLQFDPETFRFKNTGNRVHYDELTEPINEGAPKKPLLKPHEIHGDTHLELLEEVFKDGMTLKISDLEARMSRIYAKNLDTPFGGKRFKSFFDYLRNDLSLIKKDGKDNSPKAFYYLTTHHPTEHPEKGGQ